MYDDEFSTIVDSLERLDELFIKCVNDGELDNLSSDRTELVETHG